MRKETLNEVGPDRFELLVDLSFAIDESMLLEIANADYSEDAEEHLYHIKKIRDEQEFGTKLNWCPREVLELVRWSDPEHPDQKPGYDPRRGHLMRAFCCTALLCAGGLPENADVAEGENQSLAQLLDSLRYLNNDVYTIKAAKLVAYRLTDFPGQSEEHPFFILALVILLLRVNLSELLVRELAEWLLEDELRIKNAEWFICPDASERWLLGVTHYDIRHDVWIRVGAEIQESAARIRDEGVRAIVTDISARLAQSRGVKNDAANPRTLG